MIILLTIIQRLFEIYNSRQNEKLLLAQGAVLVSEKLYPWMILLHSAWLIVTLGCAIYIEYTIFYIEFLPWFGVYLVGQVLRITAIRALGKRWSTKIIVIPRAALVKKGIYKYIKHPSYLGVIMEIIALPSMGGFYLLGIIFSVLNFSLIHMRIGLEEKALEMYCAD